MSGSRARPAGPAPGPPRALRLPGATLHYAEQGAGPAVVFVHMGGRDYRYWDAQAGAFAAAGYRAVVYSRRFAVPNANPMIGDYSPRVDADDLAALIGALGAAPAHVVASSIGACAALFLAVERPELVRSLVLAEPPMLGWAEATPDGRALLAAFTGGVWRPAGDAFRRGDDADAMRVLMDYFVGPGRLAAFPPALRARVMHNARDWAAHTTSSDPFPMLERAAVRALAVPALMLSGGATLPLHRVVDAELEPLLRRGRRVVLAGASHDVWGDAGDACREATLEMLGGRR